MTTVPEQQDLETAENLRRLIDEGWRVHLECSDKDAAAMMKKLVDRPGRIITSTIRFYEKKAA